MTCLPTRVLVAGTLWLTLAATAPPAAAQAAPDRGPDAPTARIATAGDLALAEELLAEARIHERTPDRSGWLEASSLHIRSARHRPLGDEQVYRSLFRAAQLLHAVGRPLAAQRTLEQAAGHARLYGHLTREVEALLGAASIAQERADQPALTAHLSRAWLLSYAPLLPDELRREIRRRVRAPDVGPTVAVRGG